MAMLKRDEMANSHHDLSVALATFNSEQYLREQLESVISQTYPPAEIVVSDDGSTDDTLEILGSYARRDRRIVIIRNPAGDGMSRINRNFENAARRCTGSWIAFCDHDDIWLPKKLEILYRNRHAASLVYGRSEPVNEDGRPMGISVEKLLGFPAHFSGSVAPLVFLNANTVSGHTMIVHRAMLKAGMPFPESIMYDQWIALVAACKGKIRFVDEPVVLHRIHTRNSVHRVGRSIERLARRAPKIMCYREALAGKRELLVRLRDFESDLAPRDRELLAEYLKHLKRAPRCYFDRQFFRVGFGVRKRLYPRKSIWRLLKECLGGRWYGL